ncbi:efflux RND transporter permease subunit [bacterium]|nr:efflux RND transporter permease subunit [bacterium]
MKSLIRFFAERHLLANIITFIVIVLGVFSLMRMKRDMFPSVDMDRLIITTRYPGASPEDVELNVTNKLEDELQSVDGIETMTSYSMENISVITIALDQDVSDTDDTKRDIRDAVGRVSDFPEEVTDAPYILEVKSENFEILWVGVAGDVPYHELRNYAKLFEKKLKMIEGVSRVAKVGYLEREIQIEVSQSAMDRYQIPLRDIVSAIQLRNIRSTGGSFFSYTHRKRDGVLAGL